MNVGLLDPEICSISIQRHLTLCIDYFYRKNIDYCSWLVGVVGRALDSWSRWMYWTWFEPQLALSDRYWNITSTARGRPNPFIEIHTVAGGANLNTVSVIDLSMFRPETCILSIDLCFLGSTLWLSAIGRSAPDSCFNKWRKVERLVYFIDYFRILYLGIKLNTAK